MEDMRKKNRDAEIDAMIERFNMTERLGIPREKIREKVVRGMVLNNLAFVFADAANSFLIDCESELSPLGVCFNHDDKYNFKQMMTHVCAAKKWAEKSALPIYGISDSDDACADSDWWYNMAKLIDDRLGENRGKTNMLLEYILAMPSEVGLFNITYNDFKHFKKDKNGK